MFECKVLLSILNSRKIFERKVLLSILNSRKIFERDLLLSDSVANLQRKNLGFSEPETVPSAANYYETLPIFSETFLKHKTGL